MKEHKMNVAIIENDVVVNVIVVDTLELAESLISENQQVEDITDTLIGISYKRIDGVLLPPKPDYECAWHQESYRWLTQEELDLYLATKAAKLEAEANSISASE